MCDRYVRPIDKRTGKVQDFAAFGWAEPADSVLNWEARNPRLLSELFNSDADVLCLQVQTQCAHMRLFDWVSSDGRPSG